MMDEMAEKTEYEGGLSAVKATSPYEECVEILAKRLSIHDEILETLRMRLQPVVGPSGPKPESDGRTERGGRSKHVEQLADFAYRVDQQTAIVSAILGRLEI